MENRVHRGVTSRTGRVVGVLYTRSTVSRTQRLNQRANSAPVISLSDAVASTSFGSDRARVRQALAMWSAGDFAGCVVQLDEIGFARHSIGVAEVDLRDPTHLDQLAHALPWTSNLVMEQVQTLPLA
jgi:hypothetical protein